MTVLLLNGLFKDLNPLVERACAFKKFEIVKA